MERFVAADKAVADSQNDAALTLLLDLERAGPVDAELQWRLARALYLVGENSNDKEVTKENTQKAYDLITKAVASDFKSANIHKWVAITLGKLGDFSDTTAKIQNSFRIKEHALKAVELAPGDATLQHILGRWCFGVANISFIERGIASALFAAPPVSSFEEALAHFLRHEELLQDKGGGLVRNKIFVGDTLLKLNRKDEAAKYFEQATKTEAKTESDRKFVEEAKTKLAAATSSGWW